MSSAKFEDVKQELSEEDNPKNQATEENPVEELEDSDKNHGNSVPSPQQEEEIIKKKYGGILPKKPPLISKDHERAFFDSADWALGKAHRSPKDHLKHFDQNYSPRRTSNYVQGAQLMHPQVMMTVMLMMVVMIMNLPRIRTAQKMTATVMFSTGLADEALEKDCWRTFLLRMLSLWDAIQLISVN